MSDDAGAPPVLTLDFRLDGADAAALAALRPRWSARRWWALPVAGAIFGTAWPMIDDAVGVPEGDPRGLAVAAGLILALVALAVAIDARDRRRRRARIRIPEGPVRVTVLDEGLEVLAEGRRSLTPFAAIGAVDATRTHVFVRTTPDEGLMLPRRAFADRREMDAFAAWVDRRSAEAED